MNPRSAPITYICQLSNPTRNRTTSFVSLIDSPKQKLQLQVDPTSHHGSVEIISRCPHQTIGFNCYDKMQKNLRKTVKKTVCSFLLSLNQNRVFFHQTSQRSIKFVIKMTWDFLMQSWMTAITSLTISFPRLNMGCIICVRGTTTI